MIQPAPRRRRLLALALLALAPAVAAAPAGDETGTESQAALRKRLQETLARVRSACVEFEQERTLDLFDEPLRSEGVLVFEQPNRIRWETVKPYRAILVSDGASAAQYEHVDGAWKRLRLGFPRALAGVLEQVAAIHRGKLDALERDYTVSVARRPDGVVLTLVPKPPEVRRTLAAIELTLRPDLSGARQVLMKEPNGDATRIVFRNERRNPPLPEKTFDLDAPVDLKTVRERAHAETGKK